MQHIGKEQEVNSVKTRLIQFIFIIICNVLDFTEKHQRDALAPMFQKQFNFESENIIKKKK